MLYIFETALVIIIFTNSLVNAYLWGGGSIIYLYQRK